MNLYFLLIATCNFVRHVPVMCQVLSFYHHQLRTFLLGIRHIHQLGDTMVPGYIVTRDYDVLLLDACMRYKTKTVVYTVQSLGVQLFI